MTLKELLTQVGFDELLPYLEKHEPEHLDNLYDFREAYDILRNMKPANNFEGKIVAPFCTHGGGGASSTYTDIKNLAQGAEVKEGYTSYENSANIEEIGKWINSLNL